MLGWPAAIKLTLWAEVALYAYFLARWSRTHPINIAFPLVLLLGAALWPYTHAGFYLMMVGVFIWIRSGICFRRQPVRAVLAELVTAVGGMLLIGIWMPHNMLLWGVGIWLFGLIQCLYFYIVSIPDALRVSGGNQDSFEQARGELEQVLDRGW